MDEVSGNIVRMKITLSTLWIFVKDYAALMERDCWSFHPKNKRLLRCAPSWQIDQTTNNKIQLKYN
jgi:hypothetical protein